jgi:hypothetical protein
VKTGEKQFIELPPENKIKLINSPTEILVDLMDNWVKASVTVTDPITLKLIYNNVMAIQFIINERLKIENTEIQLDKDDV